MLLKLWDNISISFFSTSSNSNSSLLAALLAFPTANNGCCSHRSRKLACCGVTLVHYNMLTLVAHKSKVTLSDEIMSFVA